MFTVSTTNPLVQNEINWLNQMNRVGVHVTYKRFRIGQEDFTDFINSRQILFEDDPSALNSTAVFKWTEASPRATPIKGSYKRFRKAKAAGVPYVTEHKSYHLEHSYWEVPKATAEAESRDVWGQGCLICREGMAVQSVAEGRGKPQAFETYDLTQCTERVYHGTFLYYDYDRGYYEFPPKTFRTLLAVTSINRPKPGSFERPTLWVPEMPEDGEAMVELLQKVEQSKVDALTEIAEIGETIRGLQSNFQRTFTWFTDMFSYGKLRAKTTLTLTNLKNDNGERDVYVGSKASYNKLKRRLERKIARRKRKLSKTYQHESREVVDRLTGHWLEAQYGIGPIIGTMEDIRETLIRLESRNSPVGFRRKKAIDYRYEPTPIAGWEIERNACSTPKAYYWCFVSYDWDSFYGNIRKRTKVNPLLTAWELVPLSFVIDWFTNIGNVLSTLDIPSTFMSSEFMKVQKVVVDVTYKRETEQSTQYYKVQGYVYRRVKTSPDVANLAVLNVSFPNSWKKFVTAFSLTWAGARKVKLPKGILNG